MSSALNEQFIYFIYGLNKAILSSFLYLKLYLFKCISIHVYWINLINIVAHSMEIIVITKYVKPVLHNKKVQITGKQLILGIWKRWFLALVNQFTQFIKIARKYSTFWKKIRQNNSWVNIFFDLSLYPKTNEWN